MFRHLLTLLFCALVMPGAMAAGSVNNTSYSITDDDEKDNYPIIVSRPIVMCQSISQDSAVVVVKVRVRNITGEDVAGVVGVEIDDQEDRLVAVINDKVTVPAGKVILSSDTVTIRDPHLYSADPKYRYTVEAEFLDDDGFEISKEKEHKFVIARRAMMGRNFDNRGSRFPGRNLKNRSTDLKVERQTR